MPLALPQLPLTADLWGLGLKRMNNFYRQHLCAYGTQIHIRMALRAWADVLSAVM